MKILIAVDDPKSSQNTLKSLTAQFPAKDAEVRIVHAVPPMTYFAPPEMSSEYAPEMDDLLQQGRQQCDEVAQSLTAKGYRVSTQVAVRDARELIVDAAAEWHADLILVGSHGRTGLQRFLLGSVAEFVARHANCSVQIVRSAT